jgi:hypothetical protein
MKCDNGEFVTDHRHCISKADSTLAAVEANENSDPWVGRDHTLPALQRFLDYFKLEMQLLPSHHG